MKRIKIITLLIGIGMIAFLIKSTVYEVFALNDKKELNDCEVVNSVVIDDTFKVNERENTYVVVLDAGHGGSDGGSTNTSETYLEKDIVLDITLQLKELLEQEGVQVVSTRDSDMAFSSNTVSDLASRVAISNQNNTALFLSVHLNYYDSGSVSGFETWVNSDDQQAVQFANMIQDNLANIGYSKNRGIKDEKESPLYVIRNNQATSALVELGFITSDSDLNYLISKEGSHTIAQALKMSIISYLENNYDFIK